MLERNKRLSVEALIAAYHERTAIIAVIGLGYVDKRLLRSSTQHLISAV